MQGIPNKGRLLTALSLYFFNLLSQPHLGNVPNHVLVDSIDSPQVPEVVKKYRDQLEGRSILVKRCEVVKCEAIVRGYITGTCKDPTELAEPSIDARAGSAWAEYQKTSTVHGIPMPSGLKESSKFPEPLFTPSTKAEVGDHDENIAPEKRTSLRHGRCRPQTAHLPFILVAEVLGDADLAKRVGAAATQLYSAVADHCRSRGLILADTKLEFGLDHSTSPPTLTLVDECFTPDSSRFWPADEWAEGKRMTGFDKQFLREWLKGGGGGFATTGAGVEIPEDVVAKTWERYTEAFRLLTGKEFVV